jgi:deferrochelatase/peroxidase EfeB
MSRLTRGRFLAAGAVGAGAAMGGLGIERALSGDDGPAAAVVPFHGVHQAGIVTPAQDRLHFAAFDLVGEGRSDLRDLLRTWTVAAARMCAGQTVGETSERLRPPIDTGEAAGLHPARLTLTFGFGQSLFERVGLPRPDALRPLPRFPGDELEQERSDGDMAVQACADDPQVAFHAVEWW